ncbi:MAG: DedA family protein [Acidimicrobiia bacterium]
MTDRRRLTLLLTPIVMLVIASNVGTITSPTLVRSHPTWLLALDSRNRHLLLTVGAGIDPFPYFTVAFFRLLLSDPLFYLLGYWFGDAALRWWERKLDFNSGYIAFIEKWFARLGPALVLVMPNNIICLLAGTARMRPRTFVALNVIGTVGRLTLFWFTGRALKEPIEAFLDVVTRFQWPLTAALVVVVGFQTFRQQKTGELESGARMADEVLHEMAVEEQQAQPDADAVRGEDQRPDSAV